MRGTLNFLVKISRPRFWVYLFGTYLVGYTFGLDSPEGFRIPIFWIHLIYFMWMANFWLYGINDLYDEDTDKYNLKKGSYEVRLARERKRTVIKIVKLIGIFSIGLMLMQTVAGALMILIWGMLGWAYSSPPLRFKARVGWDFASNILYGIPGLLGYWQSSLNLPDWKIILAIWLWCGAMHLFSAIPDIKADSQAGLGTTAVKLGLRKSLITCLSLWSLAVVLAGFGLGWWSMIGLIYPGICIYLLVGKKEISAMYKNLPVVNALAGLCLFGYAIWPLIN